MVHFDHADIQVFNGTFAGLEMLSVVSFLLQDEGIFSDR